MSNVSTDHWIDWLNQARQIHPTKPLCDLLANPSEPARSAIDAAPQLSLATDQLVDLVCIDLIQQWRRGHQIPVEDFVTQFPKLNQPASLLDLIDAEMCIRRERNPSSDQQAEVDDFVQRFPKLSEQIQQLAELSLQSMAFPAANAAMPAQSNDAKNRKSASIPVDLSYDSISTQSITSSSGLTHPIPISIPEWFRSDQCITSSSNHWLLRGRDSASGKTVALKVMRLPSQVSPAGIESILQACEKASLVTHPSWLGPTVAAIQQGYLAVIRPWHFGTPWPTATDLALIPDRLRRLAQTAYAIASAHRRGAWHGAIHASNLIVDHQDAVHLIDAVASQRSLALWSESIDSDQGNRPHGDRASRWIVDHQSFSKLVLQDEVDSPGQWSKGLRETLQTIASEHRQNCFGVIGDELTRRADHFVMDNNQNAPARSWQKRLANWVVGSE